MSFLYAEWRKLAIANYVIDPEVLRKYVPANTELDLWNDGCYVSLVGFMFLNTKMLGIGFPFHRNFEEVNLRFYVRHFDGKEWKRGVVFIKEIVPKPILTFVANTVYKEHYQTMKMDHEWAENGDVRKVKYSWGKGHFLEVLADREPQSIEDGSETEFITEHYWGYTKRSESRTFEYEVTHPRWQYYPVRGHEISLDFGQVYGSDFEFLNGYEPSSVMLVEGSEITVEGKRSV